MKLSDKNNKKTQAINTACLTFKIVIPSHLYPILNDLHFKSNIEVQRMLENRDQNSSKYYKSIPCVVSKSLISKYQKNKKLKLVKNLVLPICGDKGKQIKIVENGIRIPAIFKKEILNLIFPKPIEGFVRQVEFFKRNKTWFMSFSYNSPKIQAKIKEDSFIGIDRNSVGNVAVVALPNDKTLHLGQDVSGITKNFRNRRAKLQSKGAKDALKKIKRKHTNRIKEINHKVSRQIVNLAKKHCSAIVLEDLGNISKSKKTKRYVQKSQWSHFQLKTFIEYKAALLSIPIFYINPAFTSQKCSKCGSINKAKKKKYYCSSCGYVAHRDSNAAINIKNVKQTAEVESAVRSIDSPQNLIRSITLKQESLSVAQ